MGVKKAVLEKWVVAQKRHRLSDKHVQMARELGLNPDKLGKIDNHEHIGGITTGINNTITQKTNKCNENQLVKSRQEKKRGNTKSIIHFNLDLISGQRFKAFNGISLIGV